MLAADRRFGFGYRILSEYSIVLLSVRLFAMSRPRFLFDTMLSGLTLDLVKLIRAIMDNATLFFVKFPTFIETLLRLLCRRRSTMLLLAIGR